MPLESARDILIPLNQYAVVDETATMLDALNALADTQHLVPEGMEPHRAVLVRDRDGNILGKLGHHAFLAGLEPRYLDVGKPHAFSHEGYSKRFLLSIMEQMSFWQQDFDTYAKRARSTKVSTVMHPITEHVDINAPIGEVIHKLIMHNALSLLVLDGRQRPVGMVRLADVFSVVAKNLRRRAAKLPSSD